MTSTPVYSTALQQALCLLPHISPTEMKVLITAAKAQWAPHFSNEILADSFRFISRKTLTEKICPVNSRYFQICVNSVPNVHKIEKISVGSYDSSGPTFHIAVPYSYRCSEKCCSTHGVHEIALDDFSRSAPFLRFDNVSIRTHFSKICEFFRSHRESFSQCQSLKMEDSCFESKYVLAESEVQLCSLLVDVFKNCINVKISSHDYLGRPTTFDIFQDSEKLNADDESSRNEWIGNMIDYITHYLFNTPNAFLKMNVAQESLAILIFEKVRKVFKSMTMETEFCASLIYRPDEYREHRNNVSTVENDATQQKLLVFKYSYLYGLSHEYYDSPEHPQEELRLWCRKVKPNGAKVLSSVNKISALLLQKECESLYTDLEIKSRMEEVD